MIEEMRLRNEGPRLTGEGGLLQQPTKRVPESVPWKAGSPTTSAVRVPRDTAGSFEPQIVKKRRQRLTGVDGMVLPLSAKGLTYEEPRPSTPSCWSAMGSRVCPRPWTALLNTFQIAFEDRLTPSNN
jgi:Transposase, Mutator family